MAGKGAEQRGRGGGDGRLAPSKMVYPALAPGIYYWPFDWRRSWPLRATPSDGGRTHRVEGWQVRAQTATGYAYGDGAAAAWSAFTVPGTPPPGAFTLTAPTSGATNQPTSVTLSWGASSGAASYAYCLDTTLNGSCAGAWLSAGTATSVTVSGLTSGATYEWQVRATNATGTTDATGGWRTFTVAAAAPLVKTSPTSGTTGLGTPVILTWTSTLTNVAYTVCWDQTNDGACSGVWWPNGQSLVKWLENLAPGTYYWQVRAQTPTGYVYADGETTYWSFTVGSAPAAESAPTSGGAGAAMSSAGMASDAGAEAPPPMPGLGRAGAAAWLLLAAGLAALGWRRPRQGRSRRWAVPAWLSLLALLGPAGVAAQTTGTRVEYYHLDALGSVRVVTNEAGAVRSRHDYLPFGEEWQGPSPPVQRRLFTGKERDFETGLDYFGARYYRADLGRFTTVDPELDIKAALVDPQRWNRYAYVTNNPLKYTDPDGKNPLLITAGIGAAVYGGWAIYQNVSHGQPWYNNVGMEASKGLLVGATLGLAAPALSAGSAARISVGVAETVAGPAASPLRQEYEAAVRALGDRVGALEKAGMSEEGVARNLHAARRALGVEYKNLTDPALLEKIYERNMQRYGDKLGPTIEWLRNQGKTWKQIIESASRPGGKDVL